MACLITTVYNQLLNAFCGHLKGLQEGLGKSKQHYRDDQCKYSFPHLSLTYKSDKKEQNEQLTKSNEFPFPSQAFLIWMRPFLSSESG